MNTVFIPAIFLVFVVFFPATPSSQLSAAETITDPTVLVAQVESRPVDKQGDFNSIYSYIKQKYSKVSDDDAREISQSLVDSGEALSIDPKFVAALIERESGFRKDAVSSTGARGLGQIKDFNFKDLNIENPEDIRQNVNGTAAHIKNMLSRWSDRSGRVSLALASYFRGYTAVKSLDKFDPKTEQYVGDIIKNYNYITLHKTQMSQSDISTEANL